MRLDKFICKSTDFNRNTAVSFILDGAVCVNGEVITDPVMQVHENNCVTLHGDVLVPRPFRYIMAHKPSDTICSNVDEAYPSVLKFLDIERTSELHIAGRLDADTTGLVLITDDGRWSFNIIRPTQQCEKVYRVGLRDPMSESTAVRLEQGVQLQGEASLTLPAKVTIVKPKEILLTITEGKYHQVKRMLAVVGNRVVSLHRESIGAVSLDIEVGQWRYLSAEEVECFL